MSRTGKALIQAGDEATLFVLKPLRRSKVLSPLRKGFNHLAEVGETQIDRWAAIGHAHEERSRAMTKATLNQIVTNSVTLLSDEPHVQVIVQEIVTSQSLGMTGEAIEEVRERGVTLNYRLEKIVRKTLRRPRRVAAGSRLHAPNRRWPTQGRAPRRQIQPGGSIRRVCQPLDGPSYRPAHYHCRL